MSKKHDIAFNDKELGPHQYGPRETYNTEIDKGERARATQRLDTSPYLQKEGFLGVDDLDKLRRRKISKIF